ncbi:GYD domain-containing protein [Actinopolymorpha sp. B17G11]|uniref:GYD domain-containing protein n=1 Tax=Actinopolymorpha sp. B17G11 TaxID=3160861 RepID=UPI0032E43A95
MAKFLVEANYTASGAKGLLKEGGTGRQAVVQDVCAQLGGKVEALYFAFGDHDLYSILEFPDNVSMAAVELAVKASGAVDTRTVVLLTPEELDDATRKPVEFRAPGS